MEIMDSGDKPWDGWKEMYLRMETNLTWDGKKCAFGWKQTLTWDGKKCAIGGKET